MTTPADPAKLRERIEAALTRMHMASALRGEYDVEDVEAARTLLPECADALASQAAEIATLKYADSERQALLDSMQATVMQQAAEIAELREASGDG